MAAVCCGDQGRSGHEVTIKERKHRIEERCAQPQGRPSRKASSPAAAWPAAGRSGSLFDGPRPGLRRGAGGEHLRVALEAPLKQIAFQTPASKAALLWRRRRNLPRRRHGSGQHRLEYNGHDHGGISRPAKVTGPRCRNEASIAASSHNRGVIATSRRRTPLPGGRPPRCMGGAGPSESSSTVRRGGGPEFAPVADLAAFQG